MLNKANAVVSLCYCKQTSTAHETWINGVYYISHCPNFNGPKLSIYQYSKNLIQVDLKHSKCNCELVLLQANINSTSNLDRWYVLNFSLPYFRDSSCPSTQNLGWNLDKWCVLHFSLPYFRYSSCPSTQILGSWSKLIKLSIYPHSRNLTQVYLKHSKYSCELVLLQANINSTWNLNKWCVLYFSLPYSRDKSCPST